MPDSLNVDLQLLYDLANQHDQVAEDTRQWAQPPSEWLGTFTDTYGKIAYPVYAALTRYYDARQSAGEALAQGHNQTAKALRDSAAAYQRADEAGAAGVNRAGDPFSEHSGPSGVVSPTGPTASDGFGRPGGGPATHAAGPSGGAVGGPMAGAPTPSGPTAGGPFAQDPGAGPDSQM